MAGKTVEERLQTLEDIEEIRKLKALYCAACDDDHNPDRLGPLFAPDAVWEAAVTGRAEGREAIRKLLGDVGRSGRIRNSAHHAINPIIEVDGDSARGHWRLIMLWTGNLPDGDVRFLRIIGWYREEYVRLDGRWYIQNLYCEVEESAPYSVVEEAA
ncbi:MAG: nuclear transport factor 2 family protein [Gammaproteobacteria bacterium]|nr:nuclear transport factor 2 family protein [Gammaproteobacteria bacterium]